METSESLGFLLMRLFPAAVIMMHFGVDAFMVKPATSRQILSGISRVLKDARQ